MTRHTRHFTLFLFRSLSRSFVARFHVLSTLFFSRQRPTACLTTPHPSTLHHSLSIPHHISSLHFPRLSTNPSPPRNNSAAFVSSPRACSSPPVRACVCHRLLSKPFLYINSPPFPSCLAPCHAIQPVNETRSLVTCRSALFSSADLPPPNPTGRPQSASGRVEGRFTPLFGSSTFASLPPPKGIHREQLDHSRSFGIYNAYCFQYCIRPTRDQPCSLLQLL